MKIAINITREQMGGITTTNLSLLNQLHGSNDVSFVGIELNSNRSFKSASLFRHLSPEWFSHHVISVCDYPLGVMIKRSKNLADLEKRFAPIILLIRKILQKERPDVVLLNGTYYMPWLISIACKKEKIPVVLWYAGVLSQETSHFAVKEKNLMWNMERAVVHNATKVIFPSTICKEKVQRSVVNSTKVRNALVIPNPISPLFTQHKSPESSVENRIAFVGRFAQIKNPAGFIKIHKALLKCKWKHEATIVTNVQSIDRRKIPKTITVLPSMTPSELKIFYATQGVIICPSLFETFGNVPIEAACIGIPVLVHNNMGCAEVLNESNLRKCVIDFNDEAAVIKRVKELCGQQILIRQINNLRKRVDVKYISQEIILVIKSVIEK
ncbi:MAG: glycosyltransferase family 4 protein [Patescibacteria group bacterium]